MTGHVTGRELNVLCRELVLRIHVIVGEGCWITQICCCVNSGGGAVAARWRSATSAEEAVFRMRGARLVTGMCARGALRRLNYV